MLSKRAQLKNAYFPTFLLFSNYYYLLSIILNLQILNSTFVYLKILAKPQLKKNIYFNLKSLLFLYCNLKCILFTCNFSIKKTMYGNISCWSGINVFPLFFRSFFINYKSWNNYFQTKIFISKYWNLKCKY